MFNGLEILCQITFRRIPWFGYIQIIKHSGKRGKDEMTSINSLDGLDDRLVDSLVFILVLHRVLDPLQHPWNVGVGCIVVELSADKGTKGNQTQLDSSIVSRLNDK